MSTPPIIAEAARAMLEALIDQGMVAIVMLYETPEGAVYSRVAPDLSCVRIGLLAACGGAIPAPIEPDEAGA